MLNETASDHRVTGHCTYALSNLLTIALLTYICGGEDYVDMSEFAYYRARDFSLLADCPQCSPSPDTFERLMSAVTPDEIERCLIDMVADSLTSLPRNRLSLTARN